MLNLNLKLSRKFLVTAATIFYIVFVSAPLCRFLIWYQDFWFPLTPDELRYGQAADHIFPTMLIVFSCVGAVFATIHEWVKDL